MFEKEAKERARDYTSNKERQIAYECGFLDGADRMKEEMQKLKEDNADLKQSLDWANERESEYCKHIAELEEKISVLLSCKNCPENKGGYICEKEYENKCLAQKIQYIKELKEENVELKTLIENMQRDVLSLIKDRMNDDVDQNIIERLADKWEIKENE